MVYVSALVPSTLNVLVIDTIAVATIALYCRALYRES